MKKYIAILIGVIILLPLAAQQDPQFTHYMYNTLSVNPAYAGSRGMLNVSALHRQQWIGLDGAPMTQTVFVHSPLKNDKMGVGLSVVNDRIGPINQTFIYGDYSYTVRLSQKVKLAFGMKAGINWFQPKIAGLNTIQDNDPAFTAGTVQSIIKPNIGAGIYLHHEMWYVGLSSPKMVENEFKLGQGDSSNVTSLRHGFFIAGGVIPINSDFKLKPTVQVKAVSNAPLSLDATIECLIRNQFSVGGGLRLGDSFYGMVGYQFTDQFRAGISYDYTTTKLRNVNDGSVELMLSYDFSYNKNKLKSPRYF
jgi:type IX secretion system PorP/SprF family membrane protein